MEKKFEVSEFALEAVRHFEFSGTLINVRPFGNGHINDLIWQSMIFLEWVR